MAAQINTLEFACACGLKIRARPDQGGKLYKCPSCGANIQVPKVTVESGSHAVPYSSPKPAATAPENASGFARFLVQPPATVGALITYLAAVWIVILIFCAILSLFSVVAEIVAALVFLGACGLIGAQIWGLMRARQRVLTGKKSVSVLWNFVQLIAWDPVEGIVTLKNKHVEFCDDNLEDARGGVRFIYSIFGEELALRAPLEVQTLRFRDEDVLTREFLRVTIRGTMKWRIVDIRKFYLLVSREVRSTTNHNDRETVSPSTRSFEAEGTAVEGQLLRAAISWMQVLVEEETRNVVSRARSGLLIADRLSQELFPQSHATGDSAQSPPIESGGAADSLAGAIHDTVARRLESYGIAVEDVSLQEMKLPEEIMQECIKACKTYYSPTIAKRNASFVFEDLQARADVIGRDAVAAKEVAGVAPAFALSDFLSQYLQKRMSAPASGAMSTTDDPMIAAAIAANAARLPDVDNNKIDGSR